MEKTLLSVLEGSLTPFSIALAIIVAIIILLLAKRKKLPTRKLGEFPIGEKLVARKFKRGNMVFQLHRDFRRSMSSRQIENGFYLNERPELLEEKRTYEVKSKMVPKRNIAYRTLELA
jgi:hypothetical protein